jgi:hypothetical protein
MAMRHARALSSVSSSRAALAAIATLGALSLAGVAVAPASAQRITPTELQIKPHIKSLALRWSAPVAAKLAGFQVRWRPVGRRSLGWSEADARSARTRHYSIKGLNVEPYEITVRAILTGGKRGGFTKAIASPLGLEEPPNEEEEPPKEKEHGKGKEHREEREKERREEKERKEKEEHKEELPGETWDGLSALNPMPAGLTPGSPSSPFNTPVGTPTVLANSAEMVAFLLSDIEPGELAPESITRPGGGPLPVVYASNSNPVVELVGGEGNVNGRKIRIPPQTQVGETGDKHITIVLAPIDAKVPGETVDLWLAESESSGKLDIVNGKLGYRNGSSGNITGSLIEEHPGAVSAGYDAEAGEIRGPELKAGIVPHALAAVVKDDKAGTFVYPADGTDGSSSSPAAPPNGQRFYLEYTDAEIAALGFPPWKRAILTALAHYGFYIEDTGNSTLSFRWEGARMYEPFGAPEPFAQIGEEQGVPGSGGSHTFNLAEGVDWSRLRAIAPP